MGTDISPKLDLMPSEKVGSLESEDKKAYQANGRVHSGSLDGRHEYFLR